MVAADGRTVHIRPPMTSAGTVDVRGLRSAVLDALVVAPEHLVLDLHRFRGNSELRRAVREIRECAKRRRPEVLVAVEGLMSAAPVE